MAMQRMNRRQWLLRVGSVAVGSMAFSSCGRSKVQLELDDISPKTVDAYEPISQIDCIGCDNCMPCPYGIDIPENLIFIDRARRKGFLPGELSADDFMTKGEEFFVRYCSKIPDRAQSQHCILCGQCLGTCPDGINIPERLAQNTAMTDLIRNLRCLER